MSKIEPTFSYRTLTPVEKLVIARRQSVSFCYVYCAMNCCHLNDLSNHRHRPHQSTH